MTATESVLTKKQEKKFLASYVQDGKECSIVATVRHDDRCGNGHNTFSITGILRGNFREVSCGCIHDDIAKHIPELAPFIKWHLMSTDEPMHYIANTLYHADEHGPKYAWVYYTGDSDPLNLGGTKERLVGYEKAETARKAEGKPGYRVEWDLKTAKTRNLDHARSSAVWPDATDEQLTQEPEKLKATLLARLPALMAEFRAAVESLGFTY